MSIDQQIATLEQLNDTDALIKSLSDGAAKERGEIDEVRLEVARLDERLETDRSSVTEMEKTRADLVQELRQISQQIDRSRERLQRSRNEREVNAAERELDELRKIQRDRDDEVKKLVTLSDEARLSIQQAEARKQELTQRLEGSLEGATQTIAGLEQQLTDAKNKREELAKKLPRLLRRRYDSMNQRGKVPIATTHDGTCLGCYVKLPPMVFHRMLARLQFEECPTCHRIIYYTPPPPEGEEAEAESAEAADQPSPEASS